MKELYKKLSTIQEQLKVEKKKHNDFADFNYRSCEDILQAAKPLCAAQELTLLLNDELVQRGDRFYIEATATLTDGENFITTKASAREPEKPKPKMDESQTTGSTSSYARKYALGGLFALDDGNDSDKTNNGKNLEKPAEKLITKVQLEELKKLGFTDERLQSMAKYYKVEKIEQITFKQADQAIQKQKKANAKKAEGANGQG